MPGLLAAAAAPQDASGAGDWVRDAAREHSAGLLPVLDYKLLTVSGVPITIGGLVAAAVVLLLTWVVSRLARRGLARYGARHPRTSQASLYTVSRIVQYALLAAGLLIALAAIGMPVGKFTVFAGAIGVGLGFGLQAIFNNFISGLILLFDKSLRVGDFVELESGVHGEVRDIHIRATTIVTNDNIDILVPNSEFVSGRVVNWTHGDGSRRIKVPFGVAYGVDKDTVKQAALEAAAEVPFTLTLEGARRPQVWLVNFGESSLDFELVIWLTPEATKRPSTVKAAYFWALHSALARHGLEIPFPQRDLHLRSVFGLDGEQALRALRLDTAPAQEADARPLQPSTAGNDAVDDVHRAIRDEQARHPDAAPETGEQ
ncbi:mechanosensitive ion channel domain-containing protein [Pseudoxanthomonas sp. JBR18]|uniref:mechanosensitive ion channel family protein n=1 Tax=Pseudoxanthomonas sp. JBR18 TaxID=2969308 RepID=UPI0023058D23|nr:mechanosensitive ion channel domain-containing protein [Pseudoxanthomonas sp. JBR18]WCE02664.1 mechanosensitive ion channel [Pseudoxanthomonas sp. JBR18]